MKQFLQVLKFEFSNFAKSKPYILITVVIVVLIAGFLSYPSIAGLFNKDGEAPSTKPAKIAYVDHAYQRGALLQGLSMSFPLKDIVQTDESMEQVKSKVVSGEYESAIIIESPLQYTYLTVSVNMYTDPTETISAVLTEAYQKTQLEKLGLTTPEATEIIYPNVIGIVTETGKSQVDTIYYTYILIYGLYMAIMLYGQFVATNIASEKSSRAMELLITSAKPLSLLFGKVIGTGLAGLVQFGVIFSSAFLFYKLNAGSWTDNLDIQRIFNIPLDMFLYVLLFFVIGFFLYAFIYGALGSLASRTEDVGTAIMPVTFLFIIALFIVIYGMGSGKLDSPLMIVASYIPLTSPMAMFTRIAMSNVAPIEVIISVTIAVLSTIAIGFLSAAIYRVGILMYGKPPKLGELIKTLRQKRV